MRETDRDPAERQQREYVAEDRLDVLLKCSSLPTADFLKNCPMWLSNFSVISANCTNDGKDNAHRENVSTADGTRSEDKQRCSIQETGAIQRDTSAMNRQWHGEGRTADLGHARDGPFVALHQHVQLLHVRLLREPEVHVGVLLDVLLDVELQRPGRREGERGG